MSKLEPKKEPRIVIVHFPGDERERLNQLAKRDGRSLSNMAAKLIRDGMARMERQSQQAAA